MSQTSPKSSNLHPKMIHKDEVKASTPNLNENGPSTSWDISAIPGSSRDSDSKQCTRDYNSSDCTEMEFELNMSMLRALKIMEKYTDDAHGKAMKQYESKIKSLTNKIQKEKEKVKNIKSSIQLITVVKEREDLVQKTRKKLHDVTENIGDTVEQKIKKLMDELDNTKVELKKFGTVDTEKLLDISKGILSTLNQIPELTSVHASPDQNVKKLLHETLSKLKEFKSKDARFEELNKKLERLVLHETSMKISK